MKKYFLLFIASVAVESVSGQIVFYSNSRKLQDYKGPVKSIVSYYQKTDTLHAPILDTVLSRTGETRWIKYFNKKGLLERVVTVSRPYYTAADVYKYDDEGRLICIQKEEDGRVTATIDSFVYEPKQSYVIKILNKPYDRSGGERNGPVFRERMWFDSLQRNTLIEYLDSNNFSIRTTRLFYDPSDRMTGAETYRGTLLINAWTQTYDALGRKKKISSERIQTTYNWIDNETLIWETTDVKGKLIERWKNVFVRDAHGNTIKEYAYDLQAGIAMLYEYDIEYHK